MASMLDLVKPFDRQGNLVRQAWERLSPLPGGRSMFSRMVGRAAPYTGSIRARVEELREGYARVLLRDRPALRNHLKSVHAIALANLAELTGNIAVSYALPDDARFIVAGMNMEYIKKARGTITGTCECVIPPTSERKEYEIEVLLRDQSDEVVARSTLKTLVGPKKRERGAQTTA